MAENVILNTDDRPKWLDNVGAFVIVMLTAMFCIVTIGPYFGLTPSQVDATIDANQKAVVNNLFIAVVAFFIGGSVASRKKDDTLSTAISTAATAQNALTPEKTTIPLAPGEAVTVKGEGKTK